MAIRTIQVRITGSASGVQAAAAQAQQALSGVQGAAVNVGAASQTSMASLYHGAGLVATTLRRVRYELAGVAATVVGIQGIQGLARTVDQYANLSARIRLATRDSTEFAAVQSRLLAIAQETSAPLQSTVTLYSRTASALRDLGGTQGEVLELTETINKAFAVSGATIQEQNASIIQLSQGLAAGALRGEEFNSVNEQAPRIMQALADSLGVTRGQLRALAFDGKLTSDVIREALSGEQAQKIADEYSKIPITLGRAFQQLGNAFLVAVGQLDQARGYSAGLAQAVLWVADNMDTLVKVAALTVEVLLTVFGTKLLFSAASYLASLVAMAKQYVINISLAAQLGIAQNAGILASLKSIGLLNAAFGALGAALVGWSIGSYLRDEFVEARLFGLAFIRAILVGWESIKFGAEVAWAAIKFAAELAIDYIRGQIADLVGMYASLGEAADVFGVSESVIGKLRELEAGIRGGQTAGEDFKVTLERLNAGYKANVAGIDATINDMVDYEIQTELAAQASAEAAKNIDLMSVSLGDGSASAAAMGNQLAFTKEQISDFNDALRKDQQNRDRVYDNAGRSAARLGDILARQTSFLGGPAVSAALEYRDALVELNEIEAYLAEAGLLGAESVAGLAQARANSAKIFAEDMSGVRDQVREVDQILAQMESPFERMTRDLSLLNRELDRVSDPLSEAFDPARVEALRDAIGKVNMAIGNTMIASTQEGLRSLQSMTENGSKSFAAFQVAIDALSVAQAISAVLNQGQGDPYTAFARMAAMAAAVATLVGNIGANFGGSRFTDTAAMRQETQGTGTILGDESAKSDSIARALEIIADATSALVPLNQGMLRALQGLEAGLTSAGGMLARGAGQVEYGAFDPGFMLNSRNGAAVGAAIGSVIPVIGTIMGAILGAVIGKFLGGSSRITDEGVAISGGQLSGLDFQGYQERQTRSWRFGSRRTSTAFAPLADEFANQFELIIQSITDTVRAGAEALGLLPADVQAALEAFRLEEIRISLKDLTPEEQQAELAAVFSSIFDRVAGSIVPFISQFQRLGEGLGETLVRVSTGVMVMREALSRLGFSIDSTDPERFAQISEGLIEMSGGLESFIDGMQSFIDAFASDDFKFELLQSDLTRALNDVGLAVPATRDGMWALMQSLDATTESGREQIATLLRLADTADAYYNMLEEREAEQLRAFNNQLEAIQDYNAEVQALRDELDAASLTPFAIKVRDINRWAIDAAAALNRSAIAAGATSAAAEDLALVQQVAAQRMAAAILELQNAGRSLVSRLFGTPLEQIERQISEIEAAQSGSTGSQVDGINEVGQAAQRMYEQQLEAIQEISRWLDSQLLSDVSTLTPGQRVDEARRQFDATLAAARGGDVEAMGRLTQVADAFLREGRDYFASSQAFTDIEAYVRSSLQGIVAAGPTLSPVTGGGPGGGPVSIGPSPQLEELYRERERLAAEQEAAQRADLIRELSMVIRELIQATGEPLADVANSIGLNLTQLAGTLGINLEELSADTAGSLVDLARSLGVEVAELAQSVGVSLGELGDKQSLINQALDATVAGLPEQFRLQLQQPLEDIRSATTDADANAALDNLAAISQGWPSAVRQQLEPFFSSINPQNVVTELGTLRTLSGTASEQLRALSELRGVNVDQLSALNAIRLALEGPAAPKTGANQAVSGQEAVEAIREVADRVSRVEQATAAAAENNAYEIRMLKEAILANP